MVRASYSADARDGRPRSRVLICVDAGTAPSRVVPALQSAAAVKPRGRGDADPGLQGCDGVQPPFPWHPLQLLKPVIFEGDPGPGDQVFDRL
jgi:hypothetical protein